MRDAIHDYLITAGDQIRWNRARPALLAELEDHLRSEEEACRAAGLSETEAQAEAVRQMGDPVMIGQELDSVHRPRPQWKLLGLTLAVALAVTGLRLFLTWCFRPYLYPLDGTSIQFPGHSVPIPHQKCFLPVQYVPRQT